MFKSIRPLDWLIIFVATLSLSGSTYSLFRGTWLFGSSAARGSTPVGHFSFSKNDVRRKLENSFIWLPAFSEDEVYEGDRIFTGDGSNAIVTSNKGSTVEISEMSMVVIRSKDNGIDLDLRFGDVIGRTGDGSDQITISSGNKQTVISGDNSEILISRDKMGGSNFKVLKGEVELNQAGQKTTLKKDEPSESENSPQEPVDTDVVPAMANAKLELLSPEFNEKVKLTLESDLKLKWTPVEDAVSYLVEVSNVRSFSPGIISKTVFETEYEIIEPPLNQTIYWRVTAIDMDDQVMPFTDNSQFQTVSTIPPILATPKDGAEIQLETDKNAKAFDDESVFMSWESPQVEPHFHLVIAKDAFFKNIVSKETLRTNYFDFKPEEEGEFFWQVRSVLGTEQFTSWSHVGNFSVVLGSPEQKLPAPALASQNIDFVQPYHHEKDKQLQLQWSKVEGAHSYVVEISQDDEFIVVLDSKVIKDPIYEWRSHRPGSFFWRVSAISETELRGQNSEIGTLNVFKILDPVQITTEPVDKIFVAGFPHQVTWEKLMAAEEYDVEVSTNLSFKKKLENIKQDDIQYDFVAPGPGSYFMRVRARRGAEEVGPWSKPFQFTIKKPVLDGIAIAQADMNFEADPSVFPPTDKAPLIAWSKGAEAKTYVIQISPNSDFSTLLVERTLRSTRYRWRNYRLGHFFIRVKSVSVDDRSSAYATATLNVTFPDPAITSAHVEVEELLDYYDTFKVDIHWNSVAFARYYNLKISSDPDLIEGKVSKIDILSKSLKFTKAETFYFALQPLNGASEPLSGYSKIQKINLKLSRGLIKAPTLQEPENNSAQIFQGTRIIEFNWLKAKKVQSYDLQIATDKLFKNSLVNHATPDTKYYWQGDISNGTYYWRVRSANKRYKSRWSKPFMFTVTGQ